MRDCIRYAGITPADYWDMTYRETLITLEAAAERRLDRYEDEASFAIMKRVADNKKNLKRDDLFKRPKQGNYEKKIVTLAEKRNELDSLTAELGLLQ
ncbi:hypothetical protein [Exiguobacterium sp. s102]|uniref:hypothetical protein n=1 Tax=Exiguobacterium sp. s102 TaxID=2751212 RepID=UPI001BED31FC|nr:hypothetical protein [Exiguobacterium sp. s102]